MITIGLLHSRWQGPNYRIAGNFRWVLIFAISRTVYGVAKIKTTIIYSNTHSKVGSFEIAKITIAKIISHTFTFKSRKFSSAKISRHTVSKSNKTVRSYGPDTEFGYVLTLTLTFADMTLGHGHNIRFMDNYCVKYRYHPDPTWQ